MRSLQYSLTLMALYAMLVQGYLISVHHQKRHILSLQGKQHDLLREATGETRRRSFRRGRQTSSRDSENTVSSPIEPHANSRNSGVSGGKRVMNQGKAREREIMNPNRLRIIAGSAKGKKIESPDVYLRPMMAKVREALFSTLNFMGLFEQNTTRWLDIFSGSGSIGLEALSRGACHATFVDFAEDCASTSLRNADHCGFTGQANAICAKAEDVLNHAEEYGIIEPYRVISLTPPYEEVSYDDLITALCNSKCVGEDTIVIIEYPVEMGTLPYILGDEQLFGLRNRRYGRTVLGMYVYRPKRKYDMRPDEFLNV